MTITAPQRVLTIPDIDLDTIQEVDTAVPCQIDTCVTGEPPCKNSPDFLVVFKSICDHNGNLPTGDPMVCAPHATYLASGQYGCGGCGCRVIAVGGWRHLIVKFQEI